MSTTNNGTAGTGDGQNAGNGAGQSGAAGSFLNGNGGAPGGNNPGAGGNNTNANANAAGNGAGTKVTFPDNWKDGLPDEFKNDPAINKYQTIPDLVKGYANAQKMIGKDKIVLPDPKLATADDWKGVYQKLGLADKIENYEMQPPQGAVFREEFLKEFKQKAFENNILPKQAEGLLGWYAELQQKMEKEQSTQIENTRAATVTALKQEWGQAFQEKKIASQAAAKRFFNEEGLDFLEKSGLSDNIHMAKAMASIGEILKEHGIKGSPAQSTGLTPEEAKGRIKDIMGNKNHPYWGNHEKTQEARAEMERLNNAAFGSN